MQQDLLRGLCEIPEIEGRECGVPVPGLFGSLHIYRPFVEVDREGGVLFCKDLGHSWNPEMIAETQWTSTRRGEPILAALKEESVPSRTESSTGWGINDCKERLHHSPW